MPECYQKATRTATKMVQENYQGRLVGGFHILRASRKVFVLSFKQWFFCLVYSPKTIVLDRPENHFCLWRAIKNNLMDYQEHFFVFCWHLSIIEQEQFLP